MQGAVRGLRSAVRSPLTWFTLTWLALNLLWLRTNRWTRYAELDEAGYARLAISFQRQPTWPGRWRVLTTEGVHGPLQALLTFVPMKLTAGDVRIVIGLNILLTVVAALATADLTATLAGRRAGTVAGILVLLLPGVVGFSHNALTATMPMAFIAVALAALARSRGMQHLGWSLTAGLAVGCMVAGRSMAIGFLPAVAAAGLGWAWTDRRRVIVVARNGVLTAATAVAVIGWWWVERWPAVSDYLFNGGSSDTARVGDPLAKARAHLSELEVQMGRGFVLGLMVVLLLVIVRSLRSALALARTRAASDLRVVGAGANGHGCRTAPEPRPPWAVVWPLVASVVVGLLTLGLSTAFGVGFVLPLIPATVAACVATARRVLGEEASWAWTSWVGAVLIVSLLTVVSTADRGLDAPLVWCGPGQSEVRPYCAIHDNADGERWREANDHVADRIVLARMAIADEQPTHDLAVAMTRRDLGISENMVSLSMEVRHRAGVNLSQFFNPGLTVERQLREVAADADLVIAVGDFSDPVVLSMQSPTPGQVLAAAREAGFKACDEFETPDGRNVTVLRAPSLPPAACRPPTAFGN